MTADARLGQQPRLRQVAFVVADLARTSAELRERLGLGQAFADPGVAEFGLANAVFAIGDTFLELVAPTRDGTAAGRHRARLGGDGGYMVIVQVPDTSVARASAQALGVRIVWKIDLDDISGTHFHPADTGGALLSVDTPRPPASWRWGGPRWEQRRGDGPGVAVVGGRVACADPAATAARWGVLIGAPALSSADGWCMALAGGELTFVARQSAPEGLKAVTIAISADAPDVPPPIHVGACSVEFVRSAPHNVA